jgi:hypothetical protein
VPEVVWLGYSHSQFVLGISSGFVIEGKAHGHESPDRGYALALVLWLQKAYYWLYGFDVGFNESRLRA